MKMRIQVIRVILTVVLLMGFFASLMWFLNGSLEMFPTNEQEEKAKIVSLTFMIVFASASMVCAFPFVKKKKNK